MAELNASRRFNNGSEDATLIIALTEEVRDRDSPAVRVTPVAGGDGNDALSLLKEHLAP